MTDKQRIYVHKYSRHNERVCCTSTVQLNRVHNQEYTVRMQTLPVTLNPCMYVVQNNVNVIKVTISFLLLLNSLFKITVTLNMK